MSNTEIDNGIRGITRKKGYTGKQRYEYTGKGDETVEAFHPNLPQS